MKVLFVILAVLLAFAAAGDRVTEAEDVIRGIIEGSFGAIGEEVVECIEDGALIFEDMEHAIIDFEKAIKEKSKEMLAEALAYIGDIISRLPEELKDCKGVEAVFEDLERIAAEFLNPEALIIDIGEKIIWHGIPIYRDVADTVTDFHNDRFEDAGKKIGDIIKIVFLNGVGDPIDNTDVLLTQFWKAAFKLNLDLDTCKSKLTVSINQLVADVESLLNCGEIVSCIAQAKHLVDDAEAVYADAENCTSAWPVIEEGVEDMMPLYEHPAAIIVAISEAVVMDPLQFPRDAYSLYSALSSTPIDFKTTGSSSGDIMRMVLAHMPTNGQAKKLIKESS